MAEIATFLGISRQRANALADRDDFPAPIGHLTVGRVWATKDVRAWAEKRRKDLEGEHG